MAVDGARTVSWLAAPRAPSATLGVRLVRSVTLWLRPVACDCDLRPCDPVTSHMCRPVGRHRATFPGAVRQRRHAAGARRGRHGRRHIRGADATLLPPRPAWAGVRQVPAAGQSTRRVGGGWGGGAEENNCASGEIWADGDHYYCQPLARRRFNV